MNKPMCIVQSPLATRSGYGDMARDIVQHLIELDRYDLKLISTPWGNTPMNALDGSNPIDQEMIKRIASGPLQVDRQPEIYIHITIPNEFAAPAQYNIGITAGIETDKCSVAWMDGCNKMNTVWGISNHAVNVLQNTVFEEHNEKKEVVNHKQATVPMDVLPCYVDTSVYKKLAANEILPLVDDQLSNIKEKFCFLYVGHWLKGGYGEDRKNVAVLIRSFCETFSKVVNQNRPALILKTSGADFSILDREDILKKIDMYTHDIDNCPSVYLIHGDMTREELNSLYNHPKVKVHITFTKGEGFGRPLLEASMSEKPIIASGWSGHLDFLNRDDAILLAGELKLIESGAVWENILIKEANWFNVDKKFAEKAMFVVFKEYGKYLPGAKRLAKANRLKFGSEAIKARLAELLDKYVPTFVVPDAPELVPLVLPSLSAIELPELKRVE